MSDPGWMLLQACEAVLLFHGGGPWDDDRRRKWERLMGHDDCTTKALCDFVRVAVFKAKGDQGRWVPAERLKEAQRVLGDAMEERGVVPKEWRERCERALKMLNEGMPAGNQLVREVLEGHWLAGSL